MPLIDLTCRTCAKQREHLVRRVPEVGADVEIACGDCGATGAEGLTREAAPAKTTFELRGAGWFRDGY